MIRANCESSFERSFITIAPLERSTFPVQVSAVSVAKQESSLQGEVGRCGRQETIVERLVRRSYIPVSSFEH